MIKAFPQILLTATFSFVSCITASAAQESVPATSAESGVAAAQASPSPTKNRTRVRRSQGPKAKPVAAAPIPANEPSDQQNSEAQKSAATPETAETKSATASDPAPEAEPEVESKPEEKPKPKIEAEPTPDERLRQQLKVIEQMVSAGMKKEAIAELQSLSAEDRFDPQGFYNIANAFARLDATDAAIRTYRKAIDQRKGYYSRASNNLGVVLMRQGFLDQASEAFLAALRAESFHYAEASYNLGRLYAARGEMDRATREWQRAVKVDPNHTAAARALGGVNSSGSSAVATTRASGPADRESRMSVASSASPFTLDKESYSHLQRARSAHERGRYDEAVVSYRRVISRMGGYFSPANLELTFSLIELRRNDEAIAALLPVVQRDGPRLPISYYHLARLYEVRGDLKQAEDYYTLAAETYRGTNAQFLLALSSIREKRGDFSGALSALEQYVSRKQEQGQKPDWADERLAALRQKLAASQDQPKP